MARLGRDMDLVEVELHTRRPAIVMEDDLAAQLDLLCTVYGVHSAGSLRLHHVFAASVSGLSHVSKRLVSSLLD
jgi:hypothetical protein